MTPFNFKSTTTPTRGQAWLSCFRSLHNHFHELCLQKSCARWTVMRLCSHSRRNYYQRNSGVASIQSRNSDVQPPLGFSPLCICLFSTVHCASTSVHMPFLQCASTSLLLLNTSPFWSAAHRPPPHTNRAHPLQTHPTASQMWDHCNSFPR